MELEFKVGDEVEYTTKQDSEGKGWEIGSIIRVDKNGGAHYPYCVNSINGYKKWRHKNKVRPIQGFLPFDLRVETEEEARVLWFISTYAKESMAKNGDDVSSLQGIQDRDDAQLQLWKKIDAKVSSQININYPMKPKTPPITIQGHEMKLVDGGVGFGCVFFRGSNMETLIETREYVTISKHTNWVSILLNETHLQVNENGSLLIDGHAIVVGKKTVDAIIAAWKKENNNE